MYRAATSIPTNIAEGRRQKTDKNFARFLGYALNSASELEYHLIIALDTGAIQRAEFGSLTAATVSVRKMLYRFIEMLETSDAKKNEPRATISPEAQSRLSPKPPAGSPLS
jgi:four helix bundle protein